MKARGRFLRAARIGSMKDVGIAGGFFDLKTIDIELLLMYNMYKK